MTKYFTEESSVDTVNARMGEDINPRLKEVMACLIKHLHAFAKEKRGDLLSLAMARLQRLAPGLRRVGLSATIADPDAYRSWLAPDADIDAVRLVTGEPGAGNR